MFKYASVCYEQCVGVCLHLILRACVFMCGGAHVHFSRQLAVSSLLPSLLHLSEYSASCLSSDAHIVVTDNNVKRTYILLHLIVF